MSTSPGLVTNPESVNQPTLGHGILWGMAALCIILPLFFFYHPANLIVNRGIAIIMVDEYIKFAVMLTGASLILLFYMIALGRAGRFPFPPKWIGIFTGLYAAGVIGSLTQCTSSMLCFQGTLEIYLLPPLLFLMLAASGFIGINRIRIFLWSILSAGLVNAIVAIGQKYELGFFTTKIPHLGAGGLLFNQNLAGEYLIIIIPVALILILLEKRPHLQAIALILSGMMLFHLLITLARGAWVGLIVGGVITGLVTWKAFRSKAIRPPGLGGFKRNLIWIVAPLAVILLTMAPSPRNNPYMEEFISIFTRGSPERIDIWKDSLVLLKEKWLTGVGPDNYRAVINPYLRAGARHTKWNYKAGTFRYPFRTHNDYFQTILEIGILGLLGNLGLFVTVGWFAFQGIRNALRQKDRERILLIMGTFTGFNAFAISMLFEFPMRMPTTAILGWIMAGLTVHLGVRADELRSTPIKRGMDSVLTSASAVVMLMSVFLAKELFVGSIYRSHALVGLGQNMVEAAYVWADKATVTTPWIEHVVADKMRIDLTLKRYDQAIESADFFMRYQPYVPSVHMYRTEALIRKGDLQAAKIAADDLTRLFPFIPEGWKAKEWVDARLAELTEGRYNTK